MFKKRLVGVRESGVIILDIFRNYKLCGLIVVFRGGFL